MRQYLGNKIAKLIDTRKYDWLWERINNTYFGYYVRKFLMNIMGINEEFAIRDIVAKSGEFVLKMTHPGDHRKRFNILLVQVPLPSNRRHKRILPMGLASLAAYLRKKNPEINIGILDAQCQNMEYEDIIKTMGKVRWNMVGITYWSVQSKFVSILSKGIKALDANVVIVHGGVHTTVMPEEALKTADIAVLNEGEETFAELVEAKIKNKGLDHIKGIAYRQNGKLIFNSVRPLMDDLNDLPMPAYELLPVEKYKMPLHVVGGERLPIMGSRGCPYRCSFCTSPRLWQGKVRWRDPKMIVDEIEWLIKRYDVKKFHFWDDNFTLNPRFVREFCLEIEKRDLKIQWIALDRAEHINKNKELLPLMKKSGCVGIELGLESANPDTFIHISKEQGIDESSKAIDNLKANNIYPLYTCMAFNPGESIVGYYMQKEFLDRAQEEYPWHRFFHPFSYPIYIGQFATPYPKTKFWDDLEKESMVVVDDPEDRYHHQINSVPYSLLNDAPVRLSDELDEELCVVFINAVKIGFWAYFPGNDKKDLLGKKLYEVWKFIRPFYDKCDGKSTVQDIAADLSKELQMPFSYTIRLTAYATYIFAQVGAIRSALHHREYNVVRKHVKVPLVIREDIISLLRPFGITRKNFLPKAGS